MAEYTWSFSSLKQYTNCPKQYYEIRVLKNYTVKENEAMMYGKEVHTALENYVRDGVELAKNYQRFKGMVDALINIKGEKIWEHEMALTYNKEPCEFHDENRWVTVKANGYNDVYSFPRGTKDKGRTTLCNEE